MSKQDVELEARFLEVDVPALHTKLKEIGAEDLGDDFLQEMIFYDKAFTWRQQRKLVRMRKTKRGIVVSFKHKEKPGALETKEVEIEVTDWDNAIRFLESIGLTAFREQEKKRHTYVYNDVVIDIDTWPSIPTYVEFEGKSEKEIRVVAEQLGFIWKDAVFHGAGYVIENYYNIPVMTLRFFTFDKIE